MRKLGCGPAFSYESGPAFSHKPANRVVFVTFIMQNAALQQICLFLIWSFFPHEPS
jgi:hypothetical protein